MFDQSFLSWSNGGYRWEPDGDVDWLHRTICQSRWRLSLPRRSISGPRVQSAARPVMFDEPAMREPSGGRHWLEPLLLQIILEIFGFWKSSQQFRLFSVPG